MYLIDNSLLLMGNINKITDKFKQCKRVLLGIKVSFQQIKLV